MKTYMLRTCAADMVSRHSFRWPTEGPVEAPDWSPEPSCGHGLHGLLRGEGNGELLSWASDARWLIVEVDADDVVDLGGKVKVPRGIVVHCGTQETAAAEMVRRCPGAAVVGSTLTGGDGSTLTGGYGSTLTGGHGSTLTGGDGSTLTGGYGSTLTGGDRSTLTGGDGSTLTGGDRSTLTGGYGSTLIFRSWDSSARRYRFHVAYVGEDGIRPNAPYRLVDGRVEEVRGAT